MSRFPTPPRRRPSAAGFTVLELLVVVAVLGVVLTVAYPAYTDFVERSRRSEAAEALQNTATLQEQFYTDNKYYAANLASLGMPATTSGGYYQLSITPGAVVDGTLQGYTVNAVAQGPQAGDSDCSTMQLDSSGNKTPAQCW